MPFETPATPREAARLVFEFEQRAAEYRSSCAGEMADHPFCGILEQGATSIAHLMDNLWRWATEFESVGDELAFRRLTGWLNCLGRCILDHNRDWMSGSPNVYFEWADKVCRRIEQLTPQWGGRPPWPTTPSPEPKPESPVTPGDDPPVTPGEEDGKPEPVITPGDEFPSNDGEPGAAGPEQEGGAAEGAEPPGERPPGQQPPPAQPPPGGQQPPAGHPPPPGQPPPGGPPVVPPGVKEPRPPIGGWPGGPGGGQGQPKAGKTTKQQRKEMRAPRGLDRLWAMEDPDWPPRGLPDEGRLSLSTWGANQSYVLCCWMYGWAEQMSLEACAESVCGRPGEVPARWPKGARQRLQALVLGSAVNLIGAAPGAGDGFMQRWGRRMNPNFMRNFEQRYEEAKQLCRAKWGK